MEGSITPGTSRKRFGLFLFIICKILLANTNCKSIIGFENDTKFGKVSNNK